MCIKTKKSTMFKPFIKPKYCLDNFLYMKNSFLYLLVFYLLGLSYANLLRNLRYYSDDLDFDDLVTYNDYGNLKYYIAGSIIIDNYSRYQYLYCGCTGSKAKEEDMNDLTKYDIYSYVFISEGSNDKNYFTCFICDSYECYSKTKLISLNHWQIIGIVIAVIIVILLFCCCGWYGCYRRKKYDKIKHMSKSTNNIPV